MNWKLIDHYFQMFETLLDNERQEKAPIDPDDQKIEDLISKCANLLPPLESAEKEKLIKRIKSEFAIYQEEGTAVLGDYEHDYSWYKTFLDSKESSNYYWNRYKRYLLKGSGSKKGLPLNVVNTLNEDMSAVMQYIGDPNQDLPYSTRGLVMGDIQSGKTSNYIGLIAKAADAGYKVLIILTGTVEGLRRQTQLRVEEGFVGFDRENGVDVGVKRGEQFPRSFTTRLSDFVKNMDKSTALSTSDPKPMIFVSKKNVNTLRKIYASLKAINTTREGQKIPEPCLVIDDEADNASVNTNKKYEDPTRINGQIRQLLNLFKKNAYVGFTATPFANVFISYDTQEEMTLDDLFPRDFIYSLKTPTNYFGADKYFDDNAKSICTIDDFNDNFPLKHKKTFEPDPNKMFPSFYESINTFLLINAIRDCRDADTKTHRSMLINMSNFTAVQDRLADLVRDYLKRVKFAVKLTSGYPEKTAIRNDLIRKLKQVYDKQFGHNSIGVSWETLFPKLSAAIKDIQVKVVNSKKSDRLNYYDHEKDGLRVIAIGGLALSRGLTLEGLCVSYFFRNTRVFDVLMQMGRWFGYKSGFEDLCRVYITKTSKRYYCEINDSIKELRELIDTMCAQKKTPTDYGIRVRNASIDLKITASNKMRGTRTVLDKRPIYGTFFETPYLSRDLSINEKNVEAVLRLLSNININMRDPKVHQAYFKDLKKAYIQELISNVSFEKNPERFDTSQIGNFLSRNDKELDNFDVMIMGGGSSSSFEYPVLGINQKLLKRNYDIEDNVIRISGVRARLMGRQDPKNGLSNDLITRYNLNRDNIRTQDFMIKERNPLLIIYFVKPTKEEGEEDEHETMTDKVNRLMFEQELLLQKNPYLVGLAIGFPAKEGDNTKTAYYTVNISQDYYAKKHDEEEAEE